jgi:hypothetical protein
MSSDEAKLIIRGVIASYRNRTYDELRRMIESEPETDIIEGPSGKEYLIEINAFWDNHPNGNIMWD